MADILDSASIIRDISFLYEISLAIGNSLNLKENCEVFLKTLMARKNLAYASVWIKNEYLPDQAESDGVTLVYANPESRIRERWIPDDHPLLARLTEKVSFSLSSSDPDFQEIMTEKDVTTGIFAVFALGEIGLLKLYSPTRKKPFEPQELGQLAQVIDKFAVSIEGNLAHQRSLREVAERKRAEEAVRQNEALLRSIIDATPDWIFIKDQEHRYRLANQGYAEALHLKPEDFIGQNDLELGFPEELVKGDPEQGIRGFWADDRLVMDSGETQIYPDDPATIDDEVHVFHTIKTPLQDAEGEIWGVLAFARDITEVKQSEEAVRKGEERYRRLFEDSPISLWEEDFSVIKAYTDQLHREGITDFRTYFDQHPEVVLEYANLAEVVDVNPATLKIYQAADKAEFFNGLGQIFGSESLETFKEEMIAVAEGKTRFADESIHYTLTGEKVYVTLSWSVAPGYEHDYSKVVVSLIDITEREQARELLAKRAAELGAVAEVSTAAATILDTDKLLQEVADLTKERFELYHAHIYLLDEAGDRLDLAAGAGEVGRQMVAEDWSISLQREKSLVARAAHNRQGVIVNDVRQEPGWLPNPLLPDTRSEMAVPLIVGERVLGVLDVQADEVNHFTEEDVRIQTTLAVQVAVALQNAQSYEQTQQASLLLQERVKELDCLNEVGREIEESPELPKLLQWVTERIPPAMRYSELCRVAIEYDDRVYGVPEAIDLPTQMAHGLYIGGELLGRIYIAYTEKRDFLDEESALLGGIATRLSSYIENQRLIEQVQQRAAELEETTSFLDSVLDNLPVMIFVKEAKELRHVRWNKTGLELIGRPPEEMIGKNDYDFFPKEEAEFFEAKDRETLEKGELVEIPEEPIQTANGDIRWLYTRKTPVYGADGQARYLLGISVDITERKQADQEREQLLVELREALGTADRFRQFVETSAQGIGWANLEGDVIYVNPTLCRLFGEDKPEDVYGKSVAIYYPEETQRRLQEEIFPTVVQEGRWVGELPIASKDGRTIPTFNTLFLVRDDQGQPLYLGNLLTDITEQKQAEAERERLLAEVEATYRQYVEQEWQQFLGEQHRGQWRIEHASLAVEPGGNGNNKAAIEAPIALRGQQIGSLRLEDLDAARQWTAEEKALVEAVSQQLAQTVENLRLFDETQQRATREQLTREITDRMRAAPDIDSIMQIGVEELARVLGGSHTVVELNLETEDR